MNKIKSISARFRFFFKLAIILVPLFNFSIWIFYEYLPPEVTVTLLPHSLNLSQININTTTKILACLASTLSVGVVLFALRQLLKLFKNYEEGEIFTLANVGYYRKLGYAIFAWVVSDKVVDVLISLILTFQNAVGHRQIVVRFGSADLVALAVGGLIIIIAWIMNEGHKITEEQALTI